MTKQKNSYKKFVATAATATLVASAIVPVASANVTTSAFTDVPTNYKDAVEYVISNNIAKGLDEKQFGISTQIKRGDVAIMVANAAGLNDETAETAGFSDVPTRGNLAVNSLKKVGVVVGKTPTSFGFNDNVTRGEAALMLQKAFELTAGTTTNDFTDVSDRYEAAVNALVANNVTEGINATQFGTQTPIKRGDFAKFLYALKDENNVFELEVESVKAINDIDVEFGGEYTLPATVEITLSDDSVVEVPVTWDDSSVNVNYPTTYTVEGTLDLSGMKNLEATDLKATIDVVVGEDVQIDVLKSAIAATEAYEAAPYTTLEEVEAAEQLEVTARDAVALVEEEEFQAPLLTTINDQKALVDAAKVELSKSNSTKLTLSNGTIEDGTIKNLPSTTSLRMLKDGLTVDNDGTFKVFEADGKTIATDLKDGYKVIVTAQDGKTTETYTVNILPERNSITAISSEVVNAGDVDILVNEVVLTTATVATKSVDGVNNVTITFENVADKAFDESELGEAFEIVSGNQTYVALKDADSWTLVTATENNLEIEATLTTINSLQEANKPIHAQRMLQQLANKTATKNGVEKFVMANVKEDNLAAYLVAFSKEEIKTVEKVTNIITGINAL